MILKLLYKDKEDEFEYDDFYLRDENDPTDQSSNVVISLLKDGPPSQMWFRFEHTDSDDQLQAMKVFNDLVTPYLGMGKFPKSKRDTLEELLKVIEGEDK